MSDRSWAVGLAQHDFEREFLKRHPNSDVIPMGIEWATQNDPTYRTIDAPDPEKFEEDGPSKEELDKRKMKGQFVCRGCGRSFEYKIARAGHERGCKEMIKKEEVA